MGMSKHLQLRDLQQCILAALHAVHDSAGMLADTLKQTLAFYPMFLLPLLHPLRPCTQKASPGAGARRWC